MSRSISRRIALMIESDGPGGAESVFHSLARGYRSRGFDVVPVVHAGGPGWLSDRLRDDSFSVFQPQLAGPVDAGMVNQLSHWLKAERIAFTHSHEFTMSVYGGLASRVAGVPHVMTMHGGTSYTFAMRRRVALSLAARLSRAVVGVSQNTADTLARSLGVARSRVQVIPNGIEPKAGDRRAGRAAFGVGDGECVVLAVGNLYPVKGHDTLVKAAAALSAFSDVPPWRVFIAGRGDQEQPLRSLIEEHQLEGRVSLLGLRDDIADLLAGADIFAMPSRMEGLPLAVLEAMLAKRPVVCSQVGGLPDLLEQGRLGALVPPENPEALAAALRVVMVHYDDASRVACDAYDTIVETYSADAMTSAYLRAFGQ